MSNPVNIAIIGMGGFAGSHHDRAKSLEQDGHCKVVCTCDPNPAAFAGKIQEWDLAGRGVEVFDDYVKMLDAWQDRLDVVTIPTPVPLHAPMHRAVVERGIAAYLEKPPTLDYTELEEMLAVEQKAIKLTNVGFNYITDQTRQSLKQRMFDGEFGAVRKVCFSGLWPRTTAYFNRAAWAGRLMMDGRLVLDSCMGNAMAHHVHNALFWAGQDGLFSWGQAENVCAELYRANDIEGADTVFVKAATTDGIGLQLALTHACNGDQTNPEWIVCEHATVHHTVNSSYRVVWNDGRDETGDVDPVDLCNNLQAYFDYVNGKTDRPATCLVDSKPFVHLNDLTYIAAGDITTVPLEHTDVSPKADGMGQQVSIKYIGPIIARFFESNAFPSEQCIEWAKPGGCAPASDLHHLCGAVTKMLKNCVLCPSFDLAKQSDAPIKTGKM